MTTTPTTTPALPDWCSDQYLTICREHFATQTESDLRMSLRGIDQILAGAAGGPVLPVNEPGFAAIRQIILDALTARGL